MNNDDELNNRQHSQTRIIRMKELIIIISRSRSSIFRDVAQGKFPAPIRLGARSIGWKSDEIDEWLNNRPRATNMNNQLSINGEK